MPTITASPISPMIEFFNNNNNDEEGLIQSLISPVEEETNFFTKNETLNSSNCIAYYHDHLSQTPTCQPFTRQRGEQSEMIRNLLFSPYDLTSNEWEKSRDLLLQKPSSEETSSRHSQNIEKKGLIPLSPLQSLLFRTDDSMLRSESPANGGCVVGESSDEICNERKQPIMSFNESRSALLRQILGKTCNDETAVTCYNKKIDIRLQSLVDAQCDIDCAYTNHNIAFDYLLGICSHGTSNPLLREFQKWGEIYNGLILSSSKALRFTAENHQLQSCWAKVQTNLQLYSNAVTSLSHTESYLQIHNNIQPYISGILMKLQLFVKTADEDSGNNNYSNIRLKLAELAISEELSRSICIDSESDVGGNVYKSLYKSYLSTEIRKMNECLIRSSYFTMSDHQYQQMKELTFADLVNDCSCFSRFLVSSTKMMSLCGIDAVPKLEIPLDGKYEDYCTALETTLDLFDSLVENYKIIQRIENVTTTKNETGGNDVVEDNVVHIDEGDNSVVQFESEEVKEGGEEIPLTDVAVDYTQPKTMNLPLVDPAIESKIIKENEAFDKSFLVGQNEEEFKLLSRKIQSNYRLLEENLDKSIRLNQWRLRQFQKLERRRRRMRGFEETGGRSLDGVRDGTQAETIVSTYHISGSEKNNLSLDNEPTVDKRNEDLPIYFKENSIENSISSADLSNCEKPSEIVIPLDHGIDRQHIAVYDKNARQSFAKVQGVCLKKSFEEVETQSVVLATNHENEKINEPNSNINERQVHETRLQSFLSSQLIHDKGFSSVWVNNSTHVSTRSDFLVNSGFSTTSSNRSNYSPSQFPSFVEYIHKCLFNPLNIYRSKLNGIIVTEFLMPLIRELISLFLYPKKKQHLVFSEYHFNDPLNDLKRKIQEMSSIIIDIRNTQLLHIHKLSTLWKYLRLRHKQKENNLTWCAVRELFQVMNEFSQYTYMEMVKFCYEWNEYVVDPKNLCVFDLGNKCIESLQRLMNSMGHGNLTANENILTLYDFIIQFDEYVKNGIIDAIWIWSIRVKITQVHKSLREKLYSM